MLRPDMLRPDMLRPDMLHSITAPLLLLIDHRLVVVYAFGLRRHLHPAAGSSLLQGHLLD